MTEDTRLGSEDIADWPQASIPEVGTIAAVESCMQKMLLDAGGHPDTLMIDLADCRYIEAAALVWLLALLKERSRLELETVLRLPRSKEVRDFLRVWEFPQAVRTITNRPFSRWVTKEDTAYFGENRVPADLCYAGRWISGDDGIHRLASDRFFSMRVFPLLEIRSQTRTVLEESQRWGHQLVRSVLAKYLDGPDGYVASRVVFESMTNALRHPAASFLVTTSCFQGCGEDTSPEDSGLFTIVYWDDGRSMIDTLKDALNAGKPIRHRTKRPEGTESLLDAALHSTYRVLLKKSDGTTVEETVMSSDYTPTRDTPDHLMLLATTFPGITCDVQGSGHVVHPELESEEPLWAYPGMGLHVLLNTVVDVFEGSLAVRTGSHFMNVRKASQRDKEAKYRVKIGALPTSLPPFEGNMLTIRLPSRGLRCQP